MLGFKVKAAAVAALFGAAAMAAGAANATIVNWDVTNGTFNDGGTFSGTFTINTATDSITQWDLTTTDASNGTIFFGTNYDSATMGAIEGFDFSGSPAFEQYDFAIFANGLEFTNIPFDGSGVISNLTGEEAVLALGEIPIVERTITGGEAVGVAAVPEPATWGTMILGFGLTGALLRRRRGAAALA